MQTETKPISQYTVFSFFFALDQLVQFEGEAWYNGKVVTV